MGAKIKAIELFNKITFGRENAVKRPPDEYTDRILRDLVNEANHKGDCIINVGKGYYKPRPSNAVEALDYKKYRLADSSRENDLRAKGNSMDTAFSVLKFQEECGVFNFDT